jgi:hypothetical protein
MFPTSSKLIVSNPSFGRSPSGFTRVHLELRPKEVARLLAYDPRVLAQKPRGKKAPIMPHNVSEEIARMQLAVQRSIDNTRVQQMVDYLASAFEQGTFADWGAVEVVTIDEPSMHADCTAWLDPDAEYFVADGQHRYCAMLDFIRQWPQYADRWTQGITISVLPPERFTEWAGQKFHDHNYFAVAVRPGKALAVDVRDPVNALAKQLSMHPDIMKGGGIAYDRDNLLAKDPRFTTHSIIHRFVRGFLFGRPGLDKTVDTTEPVGEMWRDRLMEFVSALALILPWFAPDRDQYVARASAVLSSLAVVGHDLYASGLPSEEIGRRLASLGGIDWRRTNLGLVGVVGTEKMQPVKDDAGNVTGTISVVQPASSRQAIDSTIRWLRQQLGLISSPNPGNGHHGGAN